MQTYEQKNIEEFPPPPPPPPPVKPDISPFDSAAPTPDNPPWNNWAALGTWVASVVFIILFPNLFLFPYLAKQNLDFSNQAAVLEFARTDTAAILLQIISILPAHVFTLLLAWLVVTNFRKYSFRQTLGWQWNGFKIWHSIVIVVFFFFLAAVLTAIFGETDNDFKQILRNSRAVVYLVAFLATFTAPLVEEVIYRGILYSSLQRKLGVIWAVVLVTFLFALVHVPQYSKDYIPDFQTVGLLLLLSLTLTVIRVRTKNLLPCIVLHTIFNGIQSLALIFEPILRDFFSEPLSRPAALFFHLFK